jgi:hypothetical protein
MFLAVCWAEPVSEPAARGHNVSTDEGGGKSHQRKPDLHRMRAHGVAETARGTVGFGTDFD